MIFITKSDRFSHICTLKIPPKRPTKPYLLYVESCHNHYSRYCNEYWKRSRLQKVQTKRFPPHLNNFTFITAEAISNLYFCVLRFFPTNGGAVGGHHRFPNRPAKGAEVVVSIGVIEIKENNNNLQI